MAALASPVWGTFTLLGGIWLFKGQNRAVWMTMVAGMVLVAANALYLVTSAHGSSAGQTAPPSAPAIMGFYVFRIAMGAYLFFSGLRGVRANSNSSPMV